MTLNVDLCVYKWVLVNKQNYKYGIYNNGDWPYLHSMLTLLKNQDKNFKISKGF